MKRIFAMLAACVLTVSAICQTAVFAAFSDVTDTNPYKDAITTLTKLSVIEGYGDNTFKPENSITRAEFTKIIVYTHSMIIRILMVTGRRITYRRQAISVLSPASATVYSIPIVR